MSETPEELRALIAGAAKAGPGPERLAAVRARLEAQLGPLDASGPAPASPSGAAPISPGAPGEPGRHHGVGSAPRTTPAEIATRGIVGVVVVALGLLTWAGTRSTAERDTAPVAPESAAAPSEPAARPAPEPVLEAPVASPEPVHAEAAAVPDPAPTTPRAARTPPPTAPAPEALVPEAAAGATTTELDPRSSLREEIALLDRALRASEAGDVAGARAALAEHRARFPTGTLSPERDRMLSELSPHEPSE